MGSDQWQTATPPAPWCLQPQDSGGHQPDLADAELSSDYKWSCLVQSGHIRNWKALRLIRQGEPKCSLLVMRTLRHSLGPQHSVASHNRKVLEKAPGNCCERGLHLQSTPDRTPECELMNKPTTSFKYDPLQHQMSECESMQEPGLNGKEHNRAFAFLPCKQRVSPSEVRKMREQSTACYSRNGDCAEQGQKERVWLGVISMLPEWAEKQN